MHNYRVSESTSTATTTSVSVSGGSQPELAIEQHQQGSFADIPTTTHAPESTYIPAAERYAGLRLLAEVSTLHVDPFVTLATHQALTFDDDEDQEQSASSLSLPDEPLVSNEPSQATDDVDPFMVVAQSHEIGISEDPKRPSGQNPGDQNADSTDKWIVYSGDKTRPFKCGYEGCGKTYLKKNDLQRHFILHIGDSQFRCYSGDCAGAIRYCDQQALARHIHREHTVERPHECDICNKRFTRSDSLLKHRRNVHSVKDKQSQPQNSDSTDKWIMYSGDITRPFKCGYEGCSKQYTRKYDLQKHFLSHIGDSQFRCYSGDCTGTMRYWDKQALARHIRRKHTMKRPHACDICPMRFGRRDYLKRHKEQVHSTEKEQTTKKSKNHHRNERENN